MKRICLRCGRSRQHKCRGLCGVCYRHELMLGDVMRYPRLSKPLEDVAADWKTLNRGGRVTIAYAADRLGMTHDALEKALTRARKAGLI